MAKASVFLPYLAAVALAAWAGWESQVIAALRAEVEELKGAAEKKSAEVQAEGQKVMKLTERNTAYQAESEGLRSQLTALHHGEALPTTAAVATANDQKGGEGWGKMMEKMMKDPDMKTMMRQQQAMAARMMYADLAKELGLSPEETEKVMEILGNRQAEMAERGMALMNGDKSQAAVQDSAKSVQEAKAKHDAELKAVLGDRYGGFEQYEKSMGDRMALQQYQQGFAAAGQALNDDQRASLLKIMAEERTNMPPNPWGADQQDVKGQVNALQNDEVMHQLLASQEDFNRRVAARAAEVLSPEQASSFGEIQNRMMQMQQMGIKMGKSMFGKK